MNHHHAEDEGVDHGVDQKPESHVGTVTHFFPRRKVIHMELGPCGILKVSDTIRVTSKSGTKERGKFRVTNIQDRYTTEPLAEARPRTMVSVRLERLSEEEHRIYEGDAVWCIVPADSRACSGWGG